VKHAVLGVGAIGGLMATALSSIGEDVESVVRAEKLATYPERITLQQPVGFITASARAVSRLTEPVDVLWISTKAYQLRSALESIEASPKIVVPLLNGVDHTAVLRSRFADERVVPATIAVKQIERRMVISRSARLCLLAGLSADRPCSDRCLACYSRAAAPSATSLRMSRR